MSIKATFTYNESLIRRAVFEFWGRTTGHFYVPLFLGLTAYFVVLLYECDFSWQTGVVGTVLFFGYTMAAMLYVVHYRNTMGKFRTLRDATVTFYADSDGFSFESSVGKTTLHWASIKEVWKFKEVWLMLFSKSQFSTLPVADLSPELQNLIVSSVHSAGGKVS